MTSAVTGQNSDILNAFTVDVEDYYHVQSFADRIDPARWDDYESRVVANTHKMLRILDDHQTRGTFFILGWVADRYPQLVRDIQHAGHEIGCHSYWHKLIYNMKPDQFRDDLRHARDLLQDITGEPVVAYRAPSFSITNDSLWALDILIEEGFQYDSSIFPIHHDNYGIPNAERFPHRIAHQRPQAISPIPLAGEGASAISPRPPAGEGPAVRVLDASTCVPATSPGEPGLWEFPPSVHRLLHLNIPIAGGGYFRLYPAWLSIHWLRRVNRVHHQPFIFYVHPWELDPDQPRLPGSLRSRFRHYQNLRSTEGKLRRLLARFRFAAVCDILDGGKHG